MTEEAVACEVSGGLADEVTFEQALDSFSSRKWWISFFVRPCCPPPAGSLAKKNLDRQRELVRSRTDFTLEQQEQLLACIDDAEAWYKTTPYWRGE